MAAFHTSGSCTITFNGVVLGKTKAGVAIRPKVTWVPVLVDQHAACPAGYIYAGQSCVIEAVLCEYNTVGSAGYHLLSSDWIPGGLLGCLTGITGDSCLIGETALTAGGFGGSGSGICKSLTIHEESSDYDWIAAYAFLLDPTELLLSSTSEQNMPVQFIIIPDSNNQLFQTQGYLR